MKTKLTKTERELLEAFNPRAELIRYFDDKITYHESKIKELKFRKKIINDYLDDESGEQK